MEKLNCSLNISALSGTAQQPLMFYPLSCTPISATMLTIWEKAHFIYWFQPGLFFSTKSNRNQFIHLMKSIKKTENGLSFMWNRVPFNFKTPSGYLVASVAQLTGVMAQASFYLQFLSFAFGSCWLFIFIAKDITTDLTAFNTAVAAKTSDGNSAELTKRFCDVVQIYTDAKQYGL